MSIRFQPEALRLYRRVSPTIMARYGGTGRWFSKLILAACRRVEREGLANVPPHQQQRRSAFALSAPDAAVPVSARSGVADPSGL